MNRQQTPYITPIQMGADGKEDVPASLALENETKPLTLKDRLIGRELYKDVDVQGTPDENGQVEISTQSYSNFRPGLLNDLASGYRENYVTGFAAPNLGQQQTADGRQKGFGYRLGEGLGSVGRFIDSPLGRGLIAAGLNSALGYDNSLQEGLTAAVGRQNAQTADRVYRNQLKQMGFDENELNNIRGNITSDMYKNIVSNAYKFRNLDQNSYVKMKTLYDRQLQQGIITPEEYKMNVEALNNQYVNSQIQTMQAGNVQESNQTRNTNMNEQLLPYKQYALQMSPQIAMGNLGVAQGNLALREQMAPLEMEYKMQQLENMKNKSSGDKATLKALTENNQTLADIDAGLQLIEENPQAYTWFKGKIGADAANRLDPKGVPARTQIDNITAVYRKWLTGAQMSDQERKAYERFLPAPTDNAQIVKAKLQGMRNSIERKNQIMLQGMNTGNANATTNNEGWAF